MHLARRVAHELLHLLQSAECGYIHTLMQKWEELLQPEESRTNLQLPFCQVHLLTTVLTDCCADSCNPLIHGSQREKLACGHPRRLHTILYQSNTILIHMHIWDT